MKVTRMHFVCRDSEHVKHLPDGRFETGFWKVAYESAKTVRVIALHDSREANSYLQGTVVDRRLVAYGDQQRYVFVVQAIDTPYRWTGNGTGEKGYHWE